MSGKDEMDFQKVLGAVVGVPTEKEYEALRKAQAEQRKDSGRAMIDEIFGQFETLFKTNSRCSCELVLALCVLCAVLGRIEDADLEYVIQKIESRSKFYQNLYIGDLLSGLKIRWQEV